MLQNNIYKYLIYYIKFLYNDFLKIFGNLKCGHLDLLFRRIAKVGRKVGVKAATFFYGFTSQSSYFFLRVYLSINSKRSSAVLTLYCEGTLKFYSVKLILTGRVRILNLQSRQNEVFPVVTPVICTVHFISCPVWQRWRALLRLRMADSRSS